jgi:hypothetical protein
MFRITALDLERAAIGEPKNDAAYLPYDRYVGEGGQ